MVVAHSNAGHYAAAVARSLPSSKVIYMDAALPEEAGVGPMVPERFGSFLVGLARDDGTLPRWTRWWDREDIAGLFPDDAWFERIDSACPEVALDYFSRGPRQPEGWSRQTSGYLAFGDSYALEVERARGYGWPVTRLPGRHLHHLIDPEGVADAISCLSERID